MADDTVAACRAALLKACLAYDDMVDLDDAAACMARAIDRALREPAVVPSSESKRMAAGFRGALAAAQGTP